MVHSSIPTLRMLRDKLGCKEKTEHGVCWYECNTSADKVAFIFHGVTGNKLDMIPLAERYVGFGYAVYLVDLPGHGGSIRPEINTYSDLDDWFVEVTTRVNRSPHLIIGTSFSSSILYHALSARLIPPQTKIILGCPTPDVSRLSSCAYQLFSKTPEALGWDIYNFRISQYIRALFALKTRRSDARLWLRESERSKKRSLTLRDGLSLSALLCDQNPYIAEVPTEYQDDIIIIIGDKDNVITSRTSVIMRRLLPEALIISVPNAGHLLQFEAVGSYPDV